MSRMPRTPGWWRVLPSLMLLGGLAWFLDAGVVFGQILAIHPAWLAVGLGVSVLQVALSAWRWWFTAKRLGLSLRYATALREYYLATFLNQVLPGGVLGDVSRAWRHARTVEARGGAVRAVIIERFSGQLLMAVTAVASLLALPGVPETAGVWAWGALLPLALGAWCTRWLGRRSAGMAVFLGDLHRALLSPHALPAQLLSSAAVVGSYLAVYVIAARGIGDATPLWELLPLVPLVLLAMLVPVSFAGWGVREGAAAVLWLLAGLDPAQGVAIAMTYGVIVLLGSLPGGLAPLFRTKSNKRSSPSENCRQTGRSA